MADTVHLPGLATPSGDEPLYTACGLRYIPNASLRNRLRLAVRLEQVSCGRCRSSRMFKWQDGYYKRKG